MRRRFVIHVIVVIVVTLICSGCWDNIELNRRVMVIGAAVDLTDDGQLKVTLQLVRTPAQGGRLSYENISGIGANVTDTVRAIGRETPDLLFFTSQRLLAISIDAARLGLLPIIDSVVRERERRETMQVVFVDGPASALLSVSNAGTLPSYGLEKLLNQQDRVGEVPPLPLNDLIEGLGQGAASVPVFAISDETGAPRARLVDNELISGDKPVGPLGLAGGRGLNWVLNQVHGGTVRITGTHEGSVFSFFPAIMKASIDAEVEAGAPIIHVSLYAAGSITEISDSTRLKTSAGAAALESAVAASLRHDIEATLAAVRTFKTDLLGIDDKLRAHRPRQWQLVAADWPAALGQLKADVSVTVSIVGTGLARFVVRPE